MKKLKVTSAQITRAAGLIAILAGSLVITYRFFTIPSFKIEFPGFDSVRYLTAFCFILSGFILLQLRYTAFLSKFRRNVVLLSSGALVVMGIISISISIFYFNKIPGIVAGENGANDFPEQMGILTAFNFSMLGLSFFLLGKQKYHLLIQILLIAIIPGSLLVIINDLFGISFLTSIPIGRSGSLLSSILFIVLCIGVFNSPGLGFFQFSFVKKVAVFFILILLVRSVVFFAINRNNLLEADKDKWVEHNREVLILAEKVSSMANDLQSNTRGYILTGGTMTPIIQPINNQNFRKLFTNLRDITNEDGFRQPRIDSLEKYTSAFITYQNELIDIRKNEGFDAAQKSLLSGIGPALLDKIHAFVNAIELNENQILAVRKAQNESIINNSSKVFTFFQVIVFVLILAAFKMIYDHVKLRNKIENALKESLKEISDYKYAIDESSILAITDQNGIITHVNDNFSKISKFKKEELIGKDHRIMNSGYYPKEFMRILWLSISNGNEWKGEIKNKAKDGSFFWVETTIVPFINESGRLYQYVSISYDITKRKNLEDNIRELNRQLQIKVDERTREVIEKEQKYHFLLQNMRESIQVIGFDWRYIFVNKSAIEQSKYSEEQLLGKTMMEKYPGIENTELFKVLHHCMKERSSEILENEFEYPDGSKQWFKLSIQPVLEGLFILSTDISERKKMEQELQERESFLNNSQAVSRIGSYVLDFKRGVWKGSRELANLFGLPPDVEHSIEDWESIVHPQYKKEMITYFEKEVTGKKQRFDKEYKIINKKTGKAYCVHGLGDLEIDNDGSIIKMLGTIQDISERKKLEHELEDRKMKQQKLITETTILAQEKERTELGRELHDNVNQILATAKMYLGMLNAGVNKPEDNDDNILLKSLEYVTAAMKEIRKLSHSLVAPSLGNLGLKEALQILVDDTNLLTGLKVNLCIDKDYAGRELDKRIELMLYRIVQEQLNNITKYAKAGRASVKLENSNGSLILSIADNGVGFDMSQKSKNGIGLKNIKSRVEFYSGKMNINSAPGKGCTLEVSVPVNSISQSEFAS